MRSESQIISQVFCLCYARENFVIHFAYSLEKRTLVSSMNVSILEVIFAFEAFSLSLRNMEQGTRRQKYFYSILKIDVTSLHKYWPRVI